MGKAHIGHFYLNGGSAARDGSVTFAAHQTAYVDLLAATLSADADMAGRRTVLHIGGRGLKPSDEGLELIRLRLGEADSDIEVGSTVAGIVIGFACIGTHIEFAAAVAGQLNIHGSAYGVVLQDAAPDTAAKSGKTVEGTFRVGGFHPDHRTGYGAVANGGNALVLLDNAHQRGYIRFFGGEYQLAVLQGKVLDFTVGNSAEQAGFIGAKFRDTEPPDRVPLAVEDALEGVAPPFGRSELVGPLIFADGIPVGNSGKVQVVFQHIPAVEVFADGVQLFHGTDGLGANPFGIEGHGLFYPHGIRGRNEETGIVAEAPFFFRTAFRRGIPAAKAVALPRGIGLGIGRQHTACGYVYGCHRFCRGVVEVEGHRTGILGKGSRANATGEDDGESESIHALKYLAQK